MTEGRRTQTQISSKVKDGGVTGELWIDTSWIHEAERGRKASREEERQSAIGSWHLQIKWRGGGLDSSVTQSVDAESGDSHLLPLHTLTIHKPSEIRCDNNNHVVFSADTVSLHHLMDSSLFIHLCSQRDETCTMYRRQIKPVELLLLRNQWKWETIRKKANDKILFEEKAVI